MESVEIPQLVVGKRLLSSAFALGAALWAILLGTAPLVATVTVAGAALIYAAGSLICHQLPERSFHLAGAQLPVCARCYGLYLGVALGALAWAVVAARRERNLSRVPTLATLAVVAAPTAVTVLTAMAGVFDPPNIWRAGLALPLGAAAGVVVGAAASRHLK
jgi:uncharacterized membrane protein